MTGLLWNIFLALAWAALTERFTLANLALGFGLGALVMWFAQRAVGAPQYLLKVRQVFGLLAFFLWELLKANLRVAFDVVTPHHHMRPAVVAVPLEAETDVEITLLATLLTLTPGSLSIDVSTDRRMLYVHDMYTRNPDQMRRRVKLGFERRVLEVLR